MGFYRIILMVLLCLYTVGAGAAVIDVAHHGATPDDATDDTAAINRACAAAGAGDTVTLGRGVFIISDAITPQSGTRLSGAGQDATILRDAGGAGHVMIRLSGVEGVEIANLALDADGTTAAQQGISATGCKKLNLHHLAIRNFGMSAGFGPHGIYFSKAVTDSVIADCRFTTIGLASEWGAGVRLSNGSSRNEVVGNAIAATGRGGILAGNDSTTLVIRRNTVSGSGGTGLGIELWGGCGGSLVEDNVIDHWLSIDRSSGSAVRRNVVSDASGVFKHCGLELVSSVDCVFTSNTVDGGADVGISISNKDPKNNIYWGGNTVRGCGTWAVQVQGEAGGAAFHYFYNNRFLDTPRGHPAQRYKDSGHAFRINDNTRALVVDGGEISGNGGGAFQFLGKNLDHHSFRNLTIERNAMALIIGRPPATLEWENNTVREMAKAAPPAAGGFGPRPRAAFECPATVRAGETVAFRNLSQAGTGTIQHMLWDFGQGLPSTERNPAVRFEQPGKVTVALIVWDSEGAGARAEKEIEVLARPHSSSRTQGE